MRNKLRHDNVLTTVERKDGEAAIEWFNKCYDRLYKLKYEQLPIPT